MQQFERYWLFAAFCLVVASSLVRLLLRERITLQSSLLLLVSLVALLLMAVWPDFTTQIARSMGFVLPSNFFFSIAIGALAVLHVGTLVTLSRLELRSIALTQELGLVREKLDRIARAPSSAVLADAPHPKATADGTPAQGR